MSRWLRTLPLTLALAGLTVFTMGCGSSDAKMRLVHAIPDASSNIDVDIDGKAVGTNVPFDSVTPSSGYLGVSSGTRHLQLFPTGTTTNPYFDSGSISFSGGTSYTIVATGSATSNTVVAPQFTDNNTAPTSGNFNLRIIHASPTWSQFFGGMDIYVVAPGTDISGVSPTVSNLTYKNASGYLSTAAGTWEVIMTPVGLKANDIDVTYTFNAGQIRTLVVVDSSGGGLSGTPLELSDLN